MGCDHIPILVWLVSCIKWKLFGSKITHTLRSPEHLSVLLHCYDGNETIAPLEEVGNQYEN